LSELRVERDQYPVDAIAWMRDSGVHGRVVVTYDWAQYAIAALCTDEFDSRRRSAVAFDGRFRTCYPQKVVDMHFDFLFGHSPHMPRNRSPQSPPIDPSRVLRHGSPDLVLLRRFGELTEVHMREQSADWALLYQDAVAQVWGRRTVYDIPGLPDWIPPELRQISDWRPAGSVMWPAIAPLKREPASELAATN
jgi:hypothetical protein